MRSLDALFAQMKDLSPAELQLVADSILAKLKSSPRTHDAPSKPACRKCGAENAVSKYGRDAKGNQRYRCKNCGAFFTDTSYSVISHTHCDVSKWKKYIECLLQGISLQKSSVICGISTRTAFLWRHKILSILEQDQSNRMLGGVVELDETFFAISYKGNHKKSKNFVMPRAPYKRGTDNNAQTGSRACVMCAVERNGQFYAEVLGKGQPTIAMFSHAFDSRILADSIVLSDKGVGVRHYFERFNDIQHIMLAAVANPAKKFGPPEIKGAFHIQNVNNMHFRLRTFLRSYNGVSTKYLNHYVNLFVWLENHKKIEKIDYRSELAQQIRRSCTYVSAHNIISLPAVPCVA